MNTSSKGFYGGVFDGRYVYLVPNNNVSQFGQITRYDTTQSFLSAASYTCFDTAQVNALSAGFNGGVFDGRYIYFVPYLNNVNYDGLVTRYDTTQSFLSAASYSFYDTAAVSANSNGFMGGVFDGRYVYLVPYHAKVLTRIDTFLGIDAMPIAANLAPNGLTVGTYSATVLDSNTPNSLLVSGNVGIGTSSPQFTLDVNGTLNATQILTGQVQNLSNPFGLLSANETAALNQGYNQGGYGGGSVGTNKQMSAASVTIFDMTSLNANSTGFQGGVFDGRYVYFVPGTTPSAQAHGQITRYDVTAPINSTSSYTTFDMAANVDTNCKGFVGAAFDGRYIYFVPYNNNSATVARYDTTQSFNSSSSYAVVGLKAVVAAAGGFQGAIFDGRYVYYVPSANGQTVRYDTSQPYTSAGSYAGFDLTAVSSNAKGLFGGTFDGRYVYFAPKDFASIVSYDTSRPFTSPSSFTVFDNTLLIKASSPGYRGAVYDGRYVYFVPNNSGNSSGSITRYDTQQPFLSAISYTCFDTKVLDVNAQGYLGAVFDGRYIYFIPNVSSGVVARYDTTQSFFATSSYTVFSTLALHSSAQGFGGGVFDGRYVYCIPYFNGAAYNGYLTRLDAYPGPQSTAIAASGAPNGFAIGTFAGQDLSGTPPPDGFSYNNSMIVSGNVGIGLTNPTFSLHLALDSAGKPSTNTWTLTSDVRIKRNIQNVPDALTKICQLRPRKFQYISAYTKDTGLDPDRTYYGFVADEVEGIVEGCVHGSNIHCYDGKMKEWFDRGATGSMPSPVPGLTDLKCFNMHNVLIHYLQAIKELAEIEDRLQAEIDELKKQL